MEGQQHFLDGFEVFRHRERLVNNIFDTNDASATQLLLDQLVRVECQTFVVHAKEAVLENNITHRVDVRIAPNHVRLDQLQKRRCFRVIRQEHCVVQLVQAQTLQNLDRSW